MPSTPLLLRVGVPTKVSISAVILLVSLVGCVSAPSLQVQVDRYSISVSLDPSTNHLTGRTTLDLSRQDESAAMPEGPVRIDFLLHEELRVTHVTAHGANLVRRTSKKQKGENTPGARIHSIIIDRGQPALTLEIDYEGKINQDIAAGERPGEIHNLEMKAHIGDEGIYLAGGYWYPQPVMPDTQSHLSDFLLVADPIAGWEFVAGAERDHVISQQTGRLAWHSPFPLDGMVLTGGQHTIHHDKHNGIDIRLHLKPEQAQHAQGLIETVKRNLDRYEPLIGPYPASEFTITDNFFSSGFAFPTFTLLSSAVINMGERSQTAHGYIDHEILHSWWGNGIFVDPNDGNWCEALASYAANYYGHVLDGKLVDARRIRRNYSHFLSRIPADKDRPLGTYGLPDGCGRGIAYQKGAMVFHMLARSIGQENFWAVMRRFTDGYVGRYANWDDIRTLCEQRTGRSLETFFRQWVRSSGAPTPKIELARFNSADSTLTIKVSQGEPTFDLHIPLRVFGADQHEDLEIHLTSATESFTVPVSLIPQTIELDPDYHVFRHIALERIIPTTSATRRGDAFTSVVPAGKVPEQFTSTRSIFESSFEKNERISLVAGEIPQGALAERNLLVLGNAVRDPYVAAFLSAVEFPIRWLETGFEFDGKTYADPGDAVLCTTSHPGVVGGGITIVFANSDEAIPKAMNLPMYPHSLVIFKEGSPVLRRDFEKRDVIRVE